LTSKSRTPGISRRSSSRRPKGVTLVWTFSALGANEHELNSPAREIAKVFLRSVIFTPNLPGKQMLARLANFLCGAVFANYRVHARH
jgi:hypothetical protein